MTRTADRPKTVVLAIAGSIAAYKAVEVARLLVKAQVRVVPIMTRAATQFIGPTTLAGICGERVFTDMFSSDSSVTEPGEPHVEIAAGADLIAVVPATAELLAGIAAGRAGDLVRATLICARCPILAAPAMHPRMWSHPATQRNVAQIARDGRVELVGPVDGVVASGDAGLGRMAEPAAIVARILAGLAPPDLAGRHVVVTAGPTVEDLDPARYLSNRSSGKMGFAIAARARARGADVSLITGPVSLSTPHGVRRIDVRSAADMLAALDETLGPSLDRADALVMAAAVADYRPAARHTAKMKRSASSLTLELVPNPDLLAGIGHRRHGRRPFLVGFALETVQGDALVELARGKLQKKGVDLVVANRAQDAFDQDDNLIVLVTKTDEEALARASKSALADRILDRIAAGCTKSAP